MLSIKEALETRPFESESKCSSDRGLKNELLARKVSCFGSDRGCAVGASRRSERRLKMLLPKRKSDPIPDRRFWSLPASILIASHIANKILQRSIRKPHRSKRLF